jgi:hypothetical protein
LGWAVLDNIQIYCLGSNLHYKYAQHTLTDLVSFFELLSSNTTNQKNSKSSQDRSFPFPTTGAKMAATLAPLPQPGFTIFPGFTATKPETFVAKDLDGFGSLASCSVSFCSPAGEPGAPFLKIKEDHKNLISFRTIEGQEVMCILKKASAWHFKSNEYTGMKPDGTEVWHLKLKKGWTRSDYGEFSTPHLARVDH